MLNLLHSLPHTLPPHSSPPYTLSLIQTMSHKPFPTFLIFIIPALGTLPPHTPLTR